jgi:hypothetical protein
MALFSDYADDMDDPKWWPPMPEGSEDDPDYEMFCDWEDDQDGQEET